jgi:hypothetical protein
MAFSDGEACRGKKGISPGVVLRGRESLFLAIVNGIDSMLAIEMRRGGPAAISRAFHDTKTPAPFITFLYNLITPTPL